MKSISRLLQSPLNRSFFPAATPFRASPSWRLTAHQRRMASSLPRFPLFQELLRHDSDRKAIVHHPSGRSFSYGELLYDVADTAADLRAKAGGRDLQGERIAFLVENGYDYVVTLLSIFANRAIAIPLCTTFPNSELRYVVDHSEALVLLSSEKFKDKAKDVIKEEVSHKPILAVEKIFEGKKSTERIVLEDIQGEAHAGLMLYTSGTTNRPKGVPLSLSVLDAQCRSLRNAWNYKPSDYVLHVLPLHHIHGTINALLAPLSVGATIEFLFPFNAQAVWERLAAPFAQDAKDKPPITFFTAVPTIYNRLLQCHPTLSADLQSASRLAISPENLRLNISGSAALPTPTKQAWADLSRGNDLLERYGMTEIGMGLSCGLDMADRMDGSVGWPLPGVEVRLVDVDTAQVIAEGEEIDSEVRERSGEIQIRGETVFNGYWRNDEATKKEFVAAEDEGFSWFRTGDVAVRRKVEGVKKAQPWCKGDPYFILGRKSADIIKTGGEKVSALEVERELLGLPEVSEAAVVGLQSDSWGQKVGAVVVLTEKGKSAGRGGKEWSPLDMRRALRDRLANYKIPQELRLVEVLPRNAMGKINKKMLVKEIFGDT